MVKGEHGLSDAERALYNYYHLKLCRVCLKPEDYCVCPQCPRCGQIGEDSCYLNHGLESHEVSVSRQEWMVWTVREQLKIEEQFLEYLKTDESYKYPWERSGGRYGYKRENKKSV